MNTQEIETICSDALDLAGESVGVEYEATSGSSLVYRGSNGHAIVVSPVPMASDLVRVVLRSRHGRLVATTDILCNSRDYAMSVAVLAACFSGFAAIPAIPA